MESTQYFIDGEKVSCTVFNKNGLAFLGTSLANDGDLKKAMDVALVKATEAKNSYGSN